MQGFILGPCVVAVWLSPAHMHAAVQFLGACTHTAMQVLGVHEGGTVVPGMQVFCEPPPPLPWRCSIQVRTQVFQVCGCTHAQFFWVHALPCRCYGHGHRCSECARAQVFQACRFSGSMRIAVQLFFAAPFFLNKNKYCDDFTV